jgi:hypothetical protein
MTAAAWPNSQAAQIASLDQRNLRLFVERIRTEYREMPGLSLTAVQARRLLGLREVAPAYCARLLDILVADGYLVRGANGVYRRRFL